MLFANICALPQTPRKEHFSLALACKGAAFTCPASRLIYIDPALTQHWLLWLTATNYDEKRPEQLFRQSPERDSLIMSALLAVKIMIILYNIVASSRLSLSSAYNVDMKYFLQQNISVSCNHATSGIMLSWPVSVLMSESSLGARPLTREVRLSGSE